MCLFLEISPYIGTTGCPHKKGYPGPASQVEEKAKRATKPNRAYQALSSLEIDRFDHPIEDSGRMRTLRSRAAVKT